MQKPSLLIIGAGVSGLIAARELATDFEIVVLEASARLGGRIQSLLQEGEIIEAGAEFVHGNLPLTLGLLKEADIDYVKVEGEMYRHKAGNFLKVEEMTEGWEHLLVKMKTVEADMTMQQLLDNHYAAPRYEALRRHVKGFVEGFDLADLNKVSVKALLEEWTAEEEDNYRIPGGYQLLIDYLQKKVVAAGAKICTEKFVNLIEWHQDAVAAYTLDRQLFTAEKMLVTVPVSVLRQPGGRGAIQFKPLVDLNEEAVPVGIGAVIKVIAKFKKAFWQPDAGFILSDKQIPTWWTQLPDKKPLLTGWLGGPEASVLANEDEDMIAEKALSSLASIYQIPVAELQDNVEWIRVFNWQRNDFAFGGYSYSLVQNGKKKSSVFTKEDTLYFAGEAFYSGPHPGTVEAALVSGIEAAAAIKKTIQF